MDVHYAPRTNTWRVERNMCITVPTENVAALVFGDPLPLPGFELVERLATPEAASERLYATLHRLDDLGLNAILLVSPPDRPEWRAIRDRIQRAGRSINVLPRSDSLS
jgi:L-threonylcarbamoyladenylate synthase